MRSNDWIARQEGPAVMCGTLAARLFGLFSLLSKPPIALLMSLVLLSVPVAALDELGLDEELTQALNLEPNLEQGGALYLQCIGCHGEQAWGSVDGEFPQIAGQHRAVLIKQIADIRYGNRDNPTMLPFAQKGVVGGAQGLSDVAGYIASLPVNSAPGTGQGNNLEHGEKLYTKNCAKCHGDDGEGDEESLFPRIQGQHYEYLLRQLNWIQEGKRRNVYRGMVNRTKKMTEADFAAVSDYLSRLPPPSP